MPAPECDGLIVAEVVGKWQGVSFCCLLVLVDLWHGNGEVLLMVESQLGLTV